MSRTSSWTDDRVKRLSQLWRDGLSAAAIAHALGGVSRNAVIGKLHRLGLAGRSKPSRPGRLKPRSGSAPRQTKLQRPQVLRAWPPIAEPIPANEGADIVSLGRRDCRWPIGDPKAADFAFCGRPVERGAYCAIHGARAYWETPCDHLLKLAGLR